MRKIKLCFAIFLLLGVLCSCKEVTTPTQKEVTTSTQEEQDLPSEKYITVHETSFTVGQINEQIKQAINTRLYYYGHHFDSDNIFSNRNLILNQNLEYDLYLVPSPYPEMNFEDLYLPQIQFVITNLDHPLSTEGERKLYMAGIEITRKGLRSDFCRGYHINEGEKIAGEFLGHYTMCFTEITTPTHDVMSDEWKNQAETALRLAMDANYFYAKEEKNLPAGNYRVYIEGFSESDSHSTVVFEHEDGRTYTSTFRYLHTITEGKPANLDKLFAYDHSDENDDYLDKLRENAVLSMEYAVKEKN